MENNDIGKLIPTSSIAVSKPESLSSVPPVCEMTIKGIKPCTKVNLSNSCCDNLELVDTIASKFSKITSGPVQVAFGMFSNAIKLNKSK